MINDRFKWVPDTHVMQYLHLRLAPVPDLDAYRRHRLMPSH